MKTQDTQEQQYINKQKITLLNGKQISVPSQIRPIEQEEKKGDDLGEKKVLSNMYMGSSILEKFVKFRLNGRTKFPSSEWKEGNHHRWDTQKHKLLKSNWGLPTGENPNNITGFDLDLYNWDDDHAFYKWIGGKNKLKQWIAEQKTLTILTASRGYHLIFQYTDLNATNCEQHNIDLKNNGGYLVGAGSIAEGKGNTGMNKYEVIHNHEPAPFPAELKEWCIGNIYPNGSSTTVDKKKKTRKPTERLNGTELVEGDWKKGYYNYEITEEEAIERMNNLPDCYIADVKKWLPLATTMKAFGYEDAFLKWSSEFPDKYNVTPERQARNKQTLKRITYDKCYNSGILSSVQEFKELNDYIKFKRAPELELTDNCIVGEKVYLSELVGDFDNKDWSIQSDCGTGKSYAFRQWKKQIKHTLCGEHQEYQCKYIPCRDGCKCKTKSKKMP